MNNATETANGAKLITDMSICRPAAALTREAVDGQWCLIDYEAGVGKGTMIIAIPSEGAPELCLTLGVEGRYDIYIGIFYSEMFMGTEQQIGLKLTGEPAFHWINKEIYYPKDNVVRQYNVDQMPNLQYNLIHETFWRSADLTGKDLIIAPQLKGKMSGLAFVRLVPCNDRPEQNPSDPSTRRVIAIFDGINAQRYESERSILDSFQPLRDTDVELLLYGAAWPDLCGYDTKVGRMLDPDCFAGSPEFVKTAGNLHRLHERGVKPLEVAIKTAHEMGLRIYGSMRLIGTHIPPAHRAPGTLIADHPEYRCVDKDGNPAPHLSLAYPAVREKFIAIFKEMAEMGMDGAHVLFCRSWPFVLYEEITVQDFINKHGRDPRELLPTDPDWLKHKCSYVTEFIRGIRAAMDEVGRAQGRKLGTAHHVQNCVANCLYYGLDVETWIKEGLVDELIPAFGWSIDNDRPVHNWEVMGEMSAEFVRLANGSSCKICPDPLPNRQLPEKFIELAIPQYRAGIDGICLWDTDGRMARLSEWAIERELGHKDDLKAWAAKGRGKDYFQLVPVYKLMDIVTDHRYSFTNG